MFITRNNTIHMVKKMRQEWYGNLIHVFKAVTGLAKSKSSHLQINKEKCNKNLST